MSHTALIAIVAASVAAILPACSTQALDAPATSPVARRFPPAVVARGAQLAAVGNCITCHTAAGGRPYAGGYPVRTPFGTIYGTNITPDPDTGLGRWSEDAFRRALREGLDRNGRHLYPAFPYDHFTLLADEDIDALYAFLMSREPVRQEVPANTVVFPRAFVAVWKALYFKPGPAASVPAAPAGDAVARGRYLAEALGHCSACHTPRNVLGAEKKARAYDGADVDNWHAPALNAASTSPVPWTVDALATYLRTGVARQHAVSAGPMRGVTRNLAQAASDDIAAIAAYVVSLDTRDPAARSAEAKAALAMPPRGPAPASGPGALLYAGTCAQCHDRGRGADGGALRLPLAIAPTLPTPSNLIHIVENGIVPNADERFAWMPSFAGSFSDEQLADLIGYVRAISGRAPWSDVAAAVRSATRSGP